MLRLNNSTENWRERLIPAIREAEKKFGVTTKDLSCYDTIANELAKDVLFRIFRAGITYQQVYTQSVGAFEIIQNGSKTERAVFESAVSAAMSKAVDLVEKTIQGFIYL